MKTSNYLKPDESHIIALQDLPDSVTVILQEQIARLCQEHKYILNCRVNVRVPNYLTEGLYQIQIVLTLPDRDLIIDREPISDYYQEDIYVAIWSAFALAKQQLKEHMVQLGYDINTSPTHNHLHQQIRPIRRCRGYAGG
jgi:hypothetical protein